MEEGVKGTWNSGRDFVPSLRCVYTCGEGQEKSSLCTRISTVIEKTLLPEGASRESVSISN